MSTHHPPPTTTSRFAPFHITTHAYKAINSQPINLHVLIPKSLPSGKHPLIVHLHGGFLITGDAMFPDWASPWALSYQLQHSAIRISANYRLLPEANGAEILSDIKDLWTWIETSLPSYLKTLAASSSSGIDINIEPDFDKVLVYGDSAGGYLAIQSGLMKPNLIKAIIAAYPMTYLDSPWYSTPSTSKSPFGSPQIPLQVLSEHQARIVPGTIISSATPPARLPLAMVTLQQGLFSKFLGEEEEIYLDRVLAKKGGEAKGGKGPFLWVFHGMGDSAVPWEQSVRFLGEWKGRFGEGSAVGEWREGEHGFDGTATVEGDEWLRRGLEGVTRKWLG
ncbi:hypothetical protein EG329_007992 [Mollisiaceae sp. DMI_Dod_QoI]|nr:hypothetical protein EG329_007992 [Helotiales sp. DMI_Dod_QoI]